MLSSKESWPKGPVVGLPLKGAVLSYCVHETISVCFNDNYVFVITTSLLNI
jgi:hypothetical protein